MSDPSKRLIAENKRTKAKVLDLGSCGLTEIPVTLGDHVWLESISLSNTPVGDLGPLSRLAGLREIDGIRPANTR